MNQLEFFVASTECARFEVRRFLRQLRELDDYIEYHLDCLRYLTEQRVDRLASSGTGTDPHSGSDEADHSDGDGEPQGRSRRRRMSPARAAPRKRERGGAAAAAVIDSGLIAALERGTPSSVRSGMLDPSVAPLTGLSAAELRKAYVFHRARALRHAEERRNIAAELAERSMELRGAMTVRLAQFEQGVEEDGGGR